MDINLSSRLSHWRFLCTREVRKVYFEERRRREDLCTRPIVRTNTSSRILETIPDRERILMKSSSNVSRSRPTVLGKRSHGQLPLSADTVNAGESRERARISRSGILVPAYGRTAQAAAAFVFLPGRSR
jgi:hypothetical protein